MTRELFVECMWVLVKGFVMLLPYVAVELLIFTAVYLILVKFEILKAEKEQDEYDDDFKY